MTTRFSSMTLIAFATSCLLAIPFVQSLLAARSRSEAPALIRKVLEEQEAAWNRRDLLGFMAGYWNSEDLTFASGADITRGWEATLARYQRKYQGEGKEMGHLKFTELEIIALSGEAAIVRGRWELTRTLDRPHGIFTLQFRKMDGNWLIISDHTSAAGG